MAIYKVFAGFPKEKCFVLTSQVRLASVSVPCNIGEQALESLNPRPLSPN
ncbi:MAG: four helix bundle protein [Deltaproteobacteria bacterium]|nr:four helix bundle protein [Deltaproteobacteria bacterium]